MGSRSTIDEVSAACRVATAAHLTNADGATVHWAARDTVNGYRRPTRLFNFSKNGRSVPPRPDRKERVRRRRRTDDQLSPKMA
jgi:hypothetical protein